MDVKQNRFEVLDSLRGIAACSVMLFHYLSAYHNEFGYDNSPLIDFEYGFYGVQLFFMISGFVIYYSISNSRSITDFLVKRAVRLFPTYWLCLVLTFSIVNYIGISSERNTTISEAIVNLSMLQGIFQVKHVDSSYWSLQIELFFYFFVAFLFFIKVQRYLNVILWSWLLLIIFYNFVFKIPVAGLFFNLQYGMLFIAGIAFYKIKVLRENNFINHSLIFCSYVAALAVLQNMDGYIWGISAVYLCFYLAVYDYLPFLKIAPLIFLGKISYALYLIHDNIGLIILQQLKTKGFNSPAFAIIPIIVSILLAWLITYYFDAHISKWLRVKLLARKADVRMAI